MESFPAIREKLAKLKQCAECDHCERMDCMYFTEPEEMLLLVDFVEHLLDEKESR